jgi:hypothetical protein
VHRGLGCSTPAASACTSRDGQAPTGCCSGRTSNSDAPPYDLGDASRRIRATGFPDAAELVERLTADDPSIADEASARFELAATSA